MVSLRARAIVIWVIMIIGVIRIIMVIIVVRVIRVFRVIRVIRVIMLIIVIRVLKVNYYQSAFNSQKEKLKILAEMLEISKSGLPRTYNRPLSL